jgi:hypothetical protein
MKKTLSFIITLAMMLTLITGCEDFINDTNTEAGSTDSANENDSTTEEDPTSSIPKEGGFDAKEAAKNFQVKEYKINDSFNYYAVYVVKNTSDVTLDINGKVETFDGESIVGAKEGGEYAVPAGQEIVLAYSFDESFTKTEYEFTAQVSSLFKGVTQDLSFTSTTAKDKEIITVTNNGTLNAEFVRATVLFFKDSELVFLNTTYVSNSDPLKPDESKSVELSCYEIYDSIEVYFSGRAD